MNFLIGLTIGILVGWAIALMIDEKQRRPQ